MGSKAELLLGGFDPRTRTYRGLPFQSSRDVQDASGKQRRTQELRRARKKGIVDVGFRFPLFEIVECIVGVIFNFCFAFLLHLARPRLDGGERCWV